MDRFDRVMHDVLRKTDDREILWRVVDAGRYSGILLNVNRIIRAFLAEYLVGLETYNLLFLERKIDLRDEFGEFEEAISLELLVLDKDGQIVLHLYDGIVERADLLRLSGLIDDRNDRTSQFFAAFDQSGAA